MARYKLIIILILLALLAFSSQAWAAAPTYVANASCNNTGTCTITPASYQNGDLFIVVTETDQADTVVVAQDLPAGWTQVDTRYATSSATSDTAIVVAWKWSTALEPAFNITETSGDRDHTYASLLVFRGVSSTVNPIDVATGVASSSTGNMTVPTITTTVDNTLIVITATRGNDQSSGRFNLFTNANLSSIAERFDNGTTTGNGGGIAVDTGIKLVAGAIGTTTVSSGTVTTYKAGIVLALKPAIPSRVYQLTEGFEGTGYEKTWTETVPADQTCNEDYAQENDANGNRPLYSGQECLRVASSASTTAQTYTQIDYGSDINLTYPHVCFKINTLTLAADTNYLRIIDLRAAAGLTMSLDIKRMSASVYEFELEYISAGAQQSAHFSDPDVATNTWYCADFRYDGESDGSCTTAPNGTCKWGFRLYNMNTPNTPVIDDTDSGNTLTGTVRIGIRYIRLGVELTATKTADVLFDRVELDSGDYIGNDTKIYGEISGITALRYQKHVLKVHNGDLFMTVAQSNMGGCGTFRSTDEGASWTLVRRHRLTSGNENCTASMVQDSNNHIYVAYSQTANVTTYGVDIDARVDKATWGGSDWTWASYGEPFGGTANTGFTCIDIAIDSTGQLWVAARENLLSSNYYYVIAYDNGSGTWTVPSNQSSFHYSNTNTQIYGMLIAYGGATKKLALLMTQQGTGYIYHFYRTDSEADTNAWSGDTAFADSEDLSGTLSSHLDADIDTDGNIHFVYQENRGTGATTLGPDRVNGHYYLCYRKLTDSTSTWSAEEFITDRTDLDRYYIGISVKTNGRLNVSLNDFPSVADNYAYLYNKVDSVWTQILAFQGDFIKRPIQAKFSKSLIEDGDYWIWEEKIGVMYYILFTNMLCGDGICGGIETSDNCGKDCHYDLFERDDSGSLGSNWVLDTNTDDGVCDEAGELCIDTNAVKAAADGTSIAHWAYPNADVTQYGKVKISSISTDGEIGMILRSPADDTTTDYRYALVYDQGSQAMGQDSFTDSDKELSTHTGENITWTKNTYMSNNDLAIISNKAFGYTDYGYYYSSYVPTSADYAVEADFTEVTSPYSGETWLALRMTTADDYTYGCGYEKDGVPPSGGGFLFKTMKNGATAFITASRYNYAFGTGETHKVKCEISGSSPTTLKLYLDGTLITSYVDSSSPITATGRAGLWVKGDNNGGFYVDNFKVFDSRLKWQRYNWNTYADQIDYEPMYMENTDTISETITGTGTSTTIKAWKNVTNNAPTNVNNWDSASDPADFTLTDGSSLLATNPADTGLYTGILIKKETGIASPTLDDFYSGDTSEAEGYSGNIMRGIMRGVCR